MRLYAGLLALSVLSAATRGAEVAPLPASSPTPPASADIKDSEKLYHESLARFCLALSKTPDAAPIPVDLGGWPALQVPSCAVVGIVLLGEGNTLSTGPQSALLNKLYKYVVIATQGALTQNNSHESWLYGFGILFLSEIQRVSPSPELKEHLARLVRRLESGQNGESGWHHSLIAKDEPYGPFIGVSMWCAAALADAKEQGVPVTETNLNAALNGLKHCVGKFGGASYYATQGSLVDAPRSAGVAWVLKRYDANPNPEAERATNFLMQNVDYAQQGHGSQVMCLGRSALAAAISGAEINTAFWKVHFKTLQSTRTADGGFQRQDWRDYDFDDAPGKGNPKERTGEKFTMFDKMYGPAWISAWMLFSWQCGLGKCVLTTKHLAAATTADEPAAKREKRAAIASAISEIEELLKTGKPAEAAKKADSALKDNPAHAGLLFLRAQASLPALTQPIGTLEAKACADGKDGWGGANELQALSLLDRALRTREGKGLVADAFDADVQLLMARIHGKRLAVSVQANPRSPDWVPLYNTFARSLDIPLKSPATQAGAAQLLQAVMAYMPKKTNAK
jgi:hypothetical protein